MTDKLLPIVAGCQALVISGRACGRTVDVLFRIEGVAPVEHNDRMIGPFEPWEIGRWLVAVHGAPIVNKRGAVCRNGALQAFRLMRIDGGRDLLMDASDMSFNLPADWRDRNEVFRK